MKKILYIVNKSEENWDFLAPSSPEGSTCVLVRGEFDSPDVPIANKYILVSDENNEVSGKMSYQTLLKEIFSSDLAMVV